MGLSLSIESQTQPDRLFAIFEAMAELVVIPKQSMLTHEMEAEGDDDMTPAGHVVKSLKLGVEGDGSPQGSPFGRDIYGRSGGETAGKFLST